MYKFNAKINALGLEKLMEIGKEIVILDIIGDIILVGFEFNYNDSLSKLVDLLKAEIEGFYYETVSKNKKSII